MADKSSKVLDKVTVQNVDGVLRHTGRHVDKELIDIMIDVIEVLADKGDQITLKEMEAVAKVHNVSAQYNNFKNGFL